MPGWAWAIIGVLIALALIGVVVALLKQRRTARLRESFGPEDRRAVAERGEQREAERDLVAREERRDSFDIRPLSAPGLLVVAVVQPDRWRHHVADRRLDIWFRQRLFAGELAVFACGPVALARGFRPPAA